MEQVTLEEHRKHIDRIDRTIVALLSERMRLGLAVGHLKREHQWPTRSAEREAEVLAHVRDAAAGPLSAPSAERIFALIIEETSAVQDRADGDE
jgi:3-deoxy-7-phosphoheptulonate synthase/chorismate mutase